MSIASHNLHTIPHFPSFTQINSTHKTVIDSFSAIFPHPNSDLNFVSLWGYMHSDCEISRIDNGLIFKLLDYHNRQPYLSYSGATMNLDLVDTLLDYSKQNKFLPHLRTLHTNMFSEDSINLIRGKYNIQKDNDFEDYIFDMDSIQKLKGGHFSDKRREINTFLKTYPEYRFERLDLNNKQVRIDLGELFMIWEKQNSHKSSRMESEAFLRVIIHSENLKLEGFGIYIGNKLVGFMLCERLNGEYIMSHFAKSDYNYKFAYSMLVYQTVCYYALQGYKYLNFQQDLGIEGLRKYKKLWRPIFYTEKYIISPKI